MGPIVLLTDFGHQDGYVGVMKGQIARIAPHVQVIDLSHDLPPQSIPAARFVLWRHFRYFPVGTIFVCVVDPGVGTARDILYVRMEGYSFLAPDNGLLDYVLAEASTHEAYVVENQNWMSLVPSNTFHGRDIFAPVAAHLANREPVKQIGPTKWLAPPESPFLSAESPGRVRAKVLYIDTYGNVITNLTLQSGQMGRVILAGEKIRQVLTYG
ncbi:MAG: SAM-dependent chlorinase/fluorinase, partial [Bacteroidota bacterium]